VGIEFDDGFFGASQYLLKFFAFPLFSFFCLLPPKKFRNIFISFAAFQSIFARCCHSVDAD